MAMADTVYSWALVTAFVSGGLCVFHVVLARMQAQLLDTALRPLQKLVPVLFVLSVLAGVLSLGVHVIAGHGAGSAEPMSPGAFASQHKAYWLLPLLWLAWFLARSKRDKELN
ncbi:MAG: hypothetical protein HKN70_06190 [Gammaproteobacteria bacterium]|nr:hypothetical protein [Gammaproteobacteria bacterium]